MPAVEDEARGRTAAVIGIASKSRMCGTRTGRVCWVARTDANGHEQEAQVVARFTVATVEAPPLGLAEASKDTGLDGVRVCG